VIRASLNWRRKSSSDPKHKRGSSGAPSRGGRPDFFYDAVSSLLMPRLADGHDKIGCRRCTHIFDAVFVIRMHEPDRAWPKPVAGSIDGELHGSFSNEPHFGMHVMVCRVGHAAGRKRRLVNLQRFARGELALQHGANLRAVGRSHRQLFERIHCRRH